MKVLTHPQSGSYAGQTASKNRFGQYLRTRAIPTNPRSAAQKTARQFLSQFSSEWSALTQAQRDAWNAAAAAFPLKDSLGQVSVMTGHMFYIAINTQRKQIFGAANAVPPVSPSPQGLNITDITSPANKTVTVHVGSPLPNADSGIGIWCSPPKAAGVSFNADYRLIGVTIPEQLPGGVDITSEMTAKFGALQNGQKFFIKMVNVSPVFGPSAPAFGSFIVGDGQQLVGEVAQQPANEKPQGKPKGKREAQE